MPAPLPFPLLAQIQDALWQHMDNLLPRPHPDLLYPSLQIGGKVSVTAQSRSDLIPKWQGPGNSAAPYHCKIKRNHPLGAHYLTKKGYAAQ